MKTKTSEFSSQQNCQPTLRLSLQNLLFISTDLQMWRAVCIAQHFHYDSCCDLINPEMLFTTYKKLHFNSKDHKARKSMQKGHWGTEEESTESHTLSLGIGRVSSGKGALWRLLGDHGTFLQASPKSSVSTQQWSMECRSQWCTLLCG